MARRIGEGEDIDNLEEEEEGYFCPICYQKDKVIANIPSRFIKHETEGIQWYCPRCECTGFM